MASRTAERRAILVGRTHGIDLAIAEELVRGGARVAVPGAMRAGRLPRRRSSEGRRGSAVVGDVTDRQHLASLAVQVEDVDALSVTIGLVEPVRRQ